MKKIFITVFVSVYTLLLHAQSSPTIYKIKAEAIYGNIIPFSCRLQDIVKDPVKGAELAIEFQTTGTSEWHADYGYPSYGLAATFLDLGNPQILGQAYAVYPYLSVPVIRTSFMKFSVKGGPGLSFLTKRYSNTNTDNRQTLTGNVAIGSMLNAYISFGSELEIPISSGVSFNAECGWNHISNGNFIAPNEGLNMINVFAGIKFMPSYVEYHQPEPRSARKVRKRLITDINLAGGTRQLYYKDNKYYPTANLTVSELYNVNNWYLTGLGADMFYDGIYGEVNAPESSYKNKLYRTYISSNKFTNKLRAGVSWQNHFVMGRLVAAIHFGLYLYDPIKDLEPYSKVKAGTNKKKGLIYPYDIYNEDGWLYTKAMIKYYLNDHLYANVSVKTHQQKAEFIGWGLGYSF